MGVHVNAVNKVADVLNTEKAAALSYIQGIVFGDQDEDTTLKVPYLWVRIPDQDPEERFAGAKDVRKASYIVHAVVVADRADKLRPYGVTGDATKRAALVIAEEVKNRLVANRTLFVNPNVPKVYDLDVRTSAVRNLGGARQEVTLELKFLARYTDGQV